MSTAKDVLARKECTARCLLSKSNKGCQCVCGGTFHGAALDAIVTAEREPEAVGA